MSFVDYSHRVIRGLLSSFRSVYDSATESFLREKALDTEKRDLSRTYLAISKVNRNVIGYITLSIKCMAVPKETLLSGKTLKGMNIESSTGVAQSYLLGQLSRSKDAPKGLGGEMLDLAFDRGMQDGPPRLPRRAHPLLHRPRVQAHHQERER